MANPIHLQSNFGMGSDFGHADYVAAVNAGATTAELRDWATRNANQFIGENTPGRGGLYDMMVTGQTPRGTRPPDNNPVNTAAGNWIGNSNTYDPSAANYLINRPSSALPAAHGDTFGNQGVSTWDPNPSSYTHPMSAEFIHDTYDPELGYQRGDSPGDNPYISNFTPKQYGYMNDPSTLTVEELAYRDGNIKGLDDRQNSIENAGALLNNYIFHIKENLQDPAELELKVGTITPQEDERKRRIAADDDDLYGPYNQYDPGHYY